MILVIGSFSTHSWSSLPGDLLPILVDHFDPALSQSFRALLLEVLLVDLQVFVRLPDCLERDRLLLDEPGLGYSRDPDPRPLLYGGQFAWLHEVAADEADRVLGQNVGDGMAPRPRPQCPAVGGQLNRLGTLDVHFHARRDAVAQTGVHTVAEIEYDVPAAQGLANGGGRGVQR